MIKNKNTLCIAEWQRFGAENIEKACNNSAQAQKIFSELVDFAHQEGNHCFLKFKDSKTLVAQNYVGLIQVKSGFCVEILPKTFCATSETQGFEVQQDENKKQDSIHSAKTLLFKMLKTLKNAPFKSSHFAHLKAQNMPLLEIFISMFLDELDNLVKKGLKSSYIIQEKNRRFLKGKLLFSQNLKYNLSHKERFFTASDEFSIDIAPNRLIKSTLEVLNKQNLGGKISAKLIQLRFVFADITPSQNIDKDLNQCANLRLFSAYDLILQWCKIFLKRQAFTSYQGSTKAFALLFDMNKLFESFVASRLRDLEIRKGMLGEFDSEIRIKTQEKCKFLALENEQNRFCLKPDIVGYEKADKDLKPVFIADTKWKILSDDSNKNYDISQNDMYQMWAYLSKYECAKGFLVYPKIDNLEQSVKEFKFKPQAISRTSLKICFFPLV